MTCERCYRPLDRGEHGLGRCPLEARRRAPVVWADSIPGGVDIQNAICNADGTPKRYYSRSEIKAACAAKGVIPYHDAYAEGGETFIKQARIHDDWLKSSESVKAQRERDEMRREKASR